MSIINDALKKTQHKLQTTEVSDESSDPKSADHSEAKASDAVREKEQPVKKDHTLTKAIQNKQPEVQTQQSTTQPTNSLSDKTQPNSAQKAAQRQNKPKLMAIAASIAFVSGLALYLGYGEPRFFSHSALPVIAQPSPALGLHLTGTMIMGNKKLAMINHRTYAVGDHVDDLIITSIQDNQVMLKKNNRLIKLTGQA